MSAPFTAQSYQRVVLLQTAAQWAETTDRVLQDYETGRESDTGYEKTGDGTTTWADLEYDTSTTPTLRVVDPDMVPWANNPALVTDNPFSVGSWTYGGNTQGDYDVADHFVGANIAFKLSATGASKYYIGSQSHIVLGGPYTGTPTVIGHYVYVNNRLHTSTGTPSLTGILSSVDVEGNSTEGVGIESSVGGGSAVSCPTLKGGNFAAAAGHVAATTLTGVEARTTVTLDANTHGTARALHAWNQISGASATISWVRGLSLDGWTGGATIANSAGIYADTSIDIGTSKWFIYSLSTSPSLITGALGIGGTANANAALDVQSTTKAFMPPRMTTTEKGNIASPTAGMVVYDSTLSKLCVYTGAAWQTVTSA